MARRLARMYDACKPLRTLGDDQRTGAAVLYGGVREDLLLNVAGRPVAAGRQATSHHSGGVVVRGVWKATARGDAFR